jgi:hypothetical protein
VRHINHCDLLIHSHLWRSQTHTVGGMHCFDHILRQFVDSRGDFRNLAAFGAQNWGGVTYDFEDHRKS